jgi:hypothetical protein
MRTLLLSLCLSLGCSELLWASHSCTSHIAQYEQSHGIPAGLLEAISKVESGRKDVGGQGYYFPTKQAAISAVEALQARGIQSIDVGCMQVNLYYHPTAFASLEEAFNPEHNVAYAASFLTKLQTAHTSWHTAVAHYHSANPSHHIPYQRQVLAQWKREKEEGRVYLASTPLHPPMVISRRRILPVVQMVESIPEENESFQPAVRRVTRRMAGGLSF